MQGTISIVTATVVFTAAFLGGMTLQQSRSDLTSAGVQQVIADIGPSPNAKVAWPPRLDKAYPDLTLTDISGKKVRLSHYRGRVLLIEPIGMSCKACQAFAGGHIVGSFGGGQPQPRLKSFSEYLRKYGGGVTLDHDRIQTVQILFYGPRGNRAPTLQEARDWANHFGRFSPDTIVLFADQEMIRPQTRAIIPGFQLVDSQFILRSDAGNPPRQDLYRTLIPMIKKVLPPN